MNGEAAQRFCKQCLLLCKRGGNKNKLCALCCVRVVFVCAFFQRLCALALRAWQRAEWVGSVREKGSEGEQMSGREFLCMWAHRIPRGIFSIDVVVDFFFLTPSSMSSPGSFFSSQGKVRVPHAFFQSYTLPLRLARKKVNNKSPPHPPKKRKIRAGAASFRLTLTGGKLDFPGNKSSSLGWNIHLPSPPS